MPDRDRLKDLEFLMRGGIAGLDHKLESLTDRVDANAHADVELRNKQNELSDAFARLDERTNMLKDHTGAHKTVKSDADVELARLKGKDDAEKEAKLDKRARQKTNAALVASTLTFLGFVIQLLIKLITGE